jgi:NAD(P)-dependent dehydrogenase (short-subunit alcohol dehydrogenase family)
MPELTAHVVVIGGTRGLGLDIASAWSERSAAVTITGRSGETAAKVAGQFAGGHVRGRACDLTDWPSIAALFAGLPPIDHLILTACDRDHNPIDAFRPDASAATSLMKNVGYASAVHYALPLFTPTASVVLFSGITMWKPIPGSTTTSMANAGVIGLMRSLAVQIAPVRVNAITPGAVEGTAAVDNIEAARPGTIEALRARTASKRLPTRADIVAAAFALTDNPGINGENLTVDGGMRLM